MHRMLARMSKVSAIWEAPITSTTKSCQTYSATSSIDSFIHMLFKLGIGPRRLWGPLGTTCRTPGNIQQHLKVGWGGPTASMQIEAPKLALANPYQRDKKAESKNCWKHIPAWFMPHDSYVKILKFDSPSLAFVCVQWCQVFVCVWLSDHRRKHQSIVVSG